MKLLFIQGGSRWKLDTENNLYTDSNFSEEIWERYRSYCSNLVVILRKEEKIYSPEEAVAKYNYFDKERSTPVILPDIYKPAKNIVNIDYLKQIKYTIDKEVKEADKIIIRSLGNIYTNTALKAAVKYDKKFVVEVTGFAWESYWYHSVKGKLVAGIKELQYRKLMRKAHSAIYVTEEALQKRYPCSGRMLGCSDVEIKDNDDTLIENRYSKIQNHEGNYIIGTAAFLDVGWKGQKYVLKAIKKLREKGIRNVQYELIGSGTGDLLKKYIKKLNIEDQVIIRGVLPHSEVFSWFDHIDIYIQPSFMEGLCRSIVEAMSRGCPVIASDVGGNYELVDEEFLFKKGDSDQISKKIETILDIKVQLDQAKRNFEKAKQYNKKLLDEKRDAFYKEFIRL